MKNLKDFKISKEKWIVIGCGILSVLVLGLIIYFLVGGGKSQEQELNKKLETMGREFYEEFYYSQVGKNDAEKEKFLKKFETLGIKVNLDNLSRYNAEENAEILKEFKNEKTKKACDKEKSRVIIYPQKPYGKTSYKIETELVCGFEKNK